MSGTIPTTVDYERYSLESYDPTNVSMTQTGRRFAEKRPGHLWYFKATYPELTQDEFLEIYAFSAKQRGSYGTFSLPAPRSNRGNYGGSPLVNGASQTGLSLVIDGATPSVTNWARAGDFINIAGTLKTYMITDDANSDVSGNVTLNLMANLMESPADNAAITVSGVVFNMSFRGDNQFETATPGPFYDLGIELIEAL